jgi:hypothetical protein
MDTFWAAVGAIATVCGVVTTVLAWLTARQASRAGDSMATIESDRWHKELTPDLQFHLIRLGPDHLRLDTTLVGPVGLDHLDKVTITVLDETGVDHNGAALNDAERAELPSVMWGPFRFTPRVNDVAEPGRETVIATGLQQLDRVPRQMEASRAPSWYRDRGQDWQRDHEGKPVRLKAVCELAGHRPWIIVRELRPQTPADGAGPAS